MFESFYIGVDLGQTHDPTAIAIIERAPLVGPWDPAVWAYRKEIQLRLRHLERVPIGTPYPQVVNRVAAITRSPELSGPIQLAVDNTGVGAAVVDLLRNARPQATILPVTITGGAEENLTNAVYHVPKRDLIVRLQVLLQQGALRVAAGLEEGPALLSELMAMQVKVSTAGNERYAAWRDGSHDDLVFAVALACWAVVKAFPHGNRQPEYWTNPHEADMVRNFQKQMERRREEQNNGPFDPRGPLLSI
jgi:hypothetical protein